MRPDRDPATRSSTRIPVANILRLWLTDRIETNLTVIWAVVRLVIGRLLLAGPCSVSLLAHHRGAFDGASSDAGQEGDSQG